MAFLNTPMSEVWKVTKRTFSEFVDVDGSSRSSTPETGSNIKTSNTNNTNTRPSNRHKVSVNTNVNDTNVNVTNVRPNHRATTNADVVRVRRTDNIDRNAKNRSQVSTTYLGQASTAKTEGRLPSSQAHINRLSVSGLHSPSSSQLKNVVRTTGSPSFQKLSQTSEPKVKHNKLQILSRGFSPPKRKTQPSSSATNTSESIGVGLGLNFSRSQTLPEINFYPQYATFQPREATVTKDYPLILPDDDSPEIERKLSNSKNEVITNVVTRPSRASAKNSKQRFRSSSSDRASEMKVIQRRPSYNTSNIDDANKSEDEDEDWLEQAEKVKLKFMSMWNNVKYGWTVKTKTPFNIHKAIWLLGKCYHHRPEDPDLDRLHPGMNTVRSPAMELFKQDFVSRIWLTYRREFPQLSGSTLTTDCGWGCMLRSGQMLLAQALILHFLERDWNIYKSQTIETDRLHRQIIQWFGDQPSDMSPFSVHHLVEIGKRCGKRAGDWFGPASVAHIIKDAVEQAPELNPLLDSVCIYVSQDCTVYKQDVIDLCTKRRKKFLKPFYHDVPDRNSTRSFSSRPSQGESIQLSQNEQNDRSISLSVCLDNESGNYVDKMCNNESFPLQRLGVVDTDVDKNTNIGDDSFEKVVREFDSAYSATNRKNEYEEWRSRNIVNGDYQQKTGLGANEGGLGHDRDPVLTRPPDQYNGEMLTNAQINVNVRTSGKSEEFVMDVEQCEEKDPHKVEIEQKTNAVQADVVNDDVTHSNNSNSPTEEYSSDWCAVIVLVPVRLGGEEVNSIYIRPIQSLFSMTNCIGIIGGKPKHSLYFVGFQDEKLIHLDPHYCQQVVDMKDKEFPIWSFHCMSPRKMSITKMDPSCTIGFYLRTREDFDKFCNEIQQVINPPGNGKDYPMFIIREGRCKDWNAQHDMSLKSERYLRVRHVNEDGNLVCPVTASEDFVLLD